MPSPVSAKRMRWARRLRRAFAEEVGGRSRHYPPAASPTGRRWPRATPAPTRRRADPVMTPRASQTIQACRMGTGMRSGTSSRRGRARRPTPSPSRRGRRGRDEERLQKELPDDVTPARADREADADLLAALLNRVEHHGEDADAADHAASRRRGSGAGPRLVDGILRRRSIGLAVVIASSSVGEKRRRSASAVRSSRFQRLVVLPARDAQKMLSMTSSSFPGRGSSAKKRGERDP